MGPDGDLFPAARGRIISLTYRVQAPKYGVPGVWACNNHARVPGIG